MFFECKYDSAIKFDLIMKKNKSRTKAKQIFYYNRGTAHSPNPRLYLNDVKWWFAISLHKTLASSFLNFLKTFQVVAAANVNHSK